MHCIEILFWAYLTASEGDCSFPSFSFSFLGWIETHLSVFWDNMAKIALESLIPLYPWQAWRAHNDFASGSSEWRIFGQNPSQCSFQMDVSTHNASHFSAEVSSWQPVQIWSTIPLCFVRTGTTSNSWQVHVQVCPFLQNSKTFLTTISYSHTNEMLFSVHFHFTSRKKMLCSSWSGFVSKKFHDFLQEAHAEINLNDWRMWGTGWEARVAGTALPAGSTASRSSIICLP